MTYLITWTTEDDGPNKMGYCSVNAPNPISAIKTAQEQNGFYIENIQTVVKYEPRI